MAAASSESPRSSRSSSINNSIDQKPTVDDVLTSLGCGLFQVIAYSLAGLSFLAYAFAVMTFPLINIQVTRELHLTGLLFAILPATCYGFNGIGSIIFGILFDNFGRVWPYALFMAIAGGFILASAFSPNFAVLVVLRALSSLGVGGIQSQVYPTVIEFLPLKYRGPTAILVMLNQAIGSAIAVGLAWWLIGTYHSGWHYFIIVTSVPFFATVVLRFIFYCESPRYLLSKGRMDAVLKTFHRIAQINSKTLNVSSVDELDYVPRQQEKGVVQQIKQAFSRFLEMFKPPLLRYTLLLAIIQPGVRQTFISSVVFFPVVLHNYGVNHFMVLLFSAIAQIPGFLLMSIIIEWPWFGRLKTMRLYMLIAVISYLLFAFVRNDVATPVFAVITFFAMNPLISIAYTYVSEIYPTEIRGEASGFMNTVQGILGIVLPFVSGYISDLSKLLPWLYGVVWASMYALLLVVSFGLTKETRGRRLTDNIVRGRQPRR